jgi:hypothetical protein
MFAHFPSNDPDNEELERFAKSFDGDGKVVLFVLAPPLPADGLGDEEAEPDPMTDLLIFEGRIISPAPTREPLIPPSVDVVAEGTYG